MENKAARILNHNDFMDIIYGSGFFGGGGGGAAEEGLALLKEMKNDATVTMIDLRDMEEKDGDKDVVSAMVAALGSPIATKGKTFSADAVNAMKKAIEVAAASGKVLKYVYSGEQGGGNTMLPVYVAWKLGLPILNLDGNGRAVPALDTGLQPINDIPTSPLIMATEKGDTVVAHTQDPLDCKTCESIARNMCQIYHQGIAISAWMMTKKQHELSSAVGQMRKTIEVGALFREIPTEMILDFLRYRLADSEFRVIVKSGTITEIIMDTEGGFDTGRIIVTENGTGIKYTVLFQNENLVLSGPNNKVYGTVPSIISLIDMGGQFARPLSNSEISLNQTVAVTVTRAGGSWYTNPKGHSCWRDVLIGANYCQVRKQVEQG